MRFLMEQEKCVRTSFQFDKNYIVSSLINNKSTQVCSYVWLNKSLWEASKSLVRNIIAWGSSKAFGTFVDVAVTRPGWIFLL